MHTLARVLTLVWILTLGTHHPSPITHHTHDSAGWAQKWRFDITSFFFIYFRVSHNLTNSTSVRESTEYSSTRVLCTYSPTLVLGRRLGLPVTLAQMHPPGKSGWNHRELAKEAGSRWPIKQQQQQYHSSTMLDSNRGYTTY